MPVSKPVKARAPSKADTAADVVLGVFKHVPPSSTLDHLVRYLGTWSGTDKALMITQYSSKLVIYLLTLSLSRRSFPSAKASATSRRASLVGRLGALSSLVGDARVLFRIHGVLAIWQWMVAIERSPPPTELLLNVERIQGWSMLIYYPLEALYYLASHSVLPISAATCGRLALVSCRFWALYVVLQLVHVVEDNRLIRLRSRALDRIRAQIRRSIVEEGVSRSEEKGVVVGGGGGSTLTDSPVLVGASVSSGSGTMAEKRRMEKAELARLDEEEEEERKALERRKDAVLNELVVNLGYAPLTLHWSLPQGLYSNDTLWTGLFGTIAAAASLRAGWRSTAILPASSSPTASAESASSESASASASASSTAVEPAVMGQ